MKTRRQAFTLMELLVTVAIIAVLASLLLPALARAKQSGYRVVCINNAKQWSFAMNFFLQDNGEYLPKENAVSSFNSWIVVSDLGTNVWYNVLPPYMNCLPAARYAPPLGDPAGFYARSSMFHCPAARFQPNNSGPQFSMAMNSKLIGADIPAVKEDLIREPSRTPYFVESGLPGEIPLPKQSAYNGQPHAYASRFSPRHNGSGTISFADSRAETMSASKVVETNPSSPNRGKAIFPSKEIVWCTDPELDPNAQ